jgi:hypothetical protein
MLLQAKLREADLRAAVVALAPVHIRLGEDGELVLGEVSELGLVAGRGLRLVCKGQLHWSVLGIRLPVTLDSLAVTIEPSIHTRAQGEALVFKLEIERAELAMVPQAIGDHVTERVNRELEEKQVELAWAFKKTLSHAFLMPASLENIESFGLRAIAGTIEVTSEELVFTVSFTSEVTRKTAGQA